MSRSKPFDFGGRFYQDAARPYSQQDVCNYLLASAEKEGTRSPKKLETPPGLYPLAQVDTVDFAPGRGIRNVEGKLFTAMGRTLYEITAAGVAIPQGTIPGYGRVGMSHNQISLGNQLTVVNGSAGYVYNTRTQTFGRITDPGFPGSKTSRFMSGYTIAIDPQGRFAQSSAPADSTAWNTLDRFTSEASPDNLVTQGVRGGSELLLLSTSTGEFFQATTNARQPIRTKKISFNKGASGPYGLAEADGNIFWHGSDGLFYMLNGYREARISTRPIERSIIGLDWSRAYAFVWEEAGHCVVYWTFPGGLTWGYDVAEREWHRRDSYGMDSWRVSDTTRWGDRWVACDAQYPRTWILDWDYPYEGEQEFVSHFTMPVIHDHQNLVIVEKIELVMDTGMPLIEPVPFAAQPAPPTITGTPPAGYVGVAYTFPFTLAAGTPPYRVTLREGTLPAGLALSSSGVLSGTPTTASAPVDLTIRNTDINGLWAETEVTLHVLQVLSEDPVYVAFNGTDTYVAVWGNAFGSTSRSATSTDGIAWTINGVFAEDCDFPARVIYGNGLFVLVSYNSSFIWTSPDGVTWTEHSLGAVEVIYDVAWDGSLFVAVGEFNTWTSVTGLSWTERARPTVAQTTWRGIAVYEDQFFALPIDGAVAAKSSDGIAWTEVTIPVLPAGEWRRVIALDDWLLAVPEGSVAGAWGDGIDTWAAFGFPYADNRSLAWNGSRIFVASQDNTPSSYSDDEGATYADVILPPMVGVDDDYGSAYDVCTAGATGADFLVGGHGVTYYVAGAAP